MAKLGKKDVNLSVKNVFDDSYKKFVSTSQNQKIIDFFTDKPYFQRTAKLAGLAILLAILCNLISGLTESVFLYEKINLFIPKFPLSPALVIALVTAIIVAIEGMKRRTLPQIFRYWFQYREADYINISLYLLAVVISIYLSFNGSQYLPEMVTKPALQNIDEINAKYDYLIVQAEKDAKDYFEANNWKGKLDGSSRPTYNKLNEAVTDLKSQKLDAEKLVKADNKASTESWESDNEKSGLQLAYITVTSELILFVLVGFLIYRKWRHVAQFANIEYIETADKQVRTIKTKDKKALDENRLDENRLESDLRKCSHCNGEYLTRHHKQKYCSEDCRKEAYNKRNGKEKYKMNGQH